MPDGDMIRNNLPRNKIVLPYSDDLPMYDLRKGSARVKLEYDPLKVNRKIRNCAKYVHSASQSAKSAAAAAAAKLKPHRLLLSFGQTQLAKNKSCISGTLSKCFGVLERDVHAASGSARVVTGTSMMSFYGYLGGYKETGTSGT